MDRKNPSIVVMNLIILSVAVRSYATKTNVVYLPPLDTIILKKPLSAPRNVGFGAVITGRNFHQDQNKFHLQMYDFHNPNFQYDLPPEYKAKSLTQPDRTKPAYDKSVEVFRNMGYNDDREHKPSFKSTNTIPRHHGLTSAGTKTQGQSYRTKDDKMYNFQLRLNQTNTQPKSINLLSSSVTSKSNENFFVNPDFKNDTFAAETQEETTETIGSNKAFQSKGVALSFAPVKSSTTNKHGSKIRFNYQQPMITTATTQPIHETSVSDLYKANYRIHNQEYKNLLNALTPQEPNPVSKQNSMTFDLTEVANINEPAKLYQIPVNYTNWKFW